VTSCLFASDLHGRTGRYRKLFDRVASAPPAVVLLGGDLLPFGDPRFLERTLRAECRRLRRRLAERYPRWLIILGNDDPRTQEAGLVDGEKEGLWNYLHGHCLRIDGHRFCGYACVPPTPFLLKDWERYDVSRHLDVGSVSPEEGWRSVPVDAGEVSTGTIRTDLERLVEGATGLAGAEGTEGLADALFLFHAPPYGGLLDLADLGSRAVDHAPLDSHVGSIAVRRFIEEQRPRVTLHGHVHESSRLSGSWRERIGATHCFSAAWDGSELAVVSFTLERPEDAERLLL
jgi:Icc-related predicted phosphoesterase